MKKEQVKCRICGKKFSFYPSSRKQAKYCSRNCFYRSIRNRKLSKIHKERIGSANSKRKHKKVEGFQRGHAQLNTGRTHFKKGQHAREKHPNWRGGKTKLTKAIRNIPKYFEWRNKVFRRDNYTCVECEKHGGNLEAHHIKRFIDIIIDNNINSIEDALQCNELWNLNNGKTLCMECHHETKLKTIT